VVRPCTNAAALMTPVVVQGRFRGVSRRAGDVSGQTHPVDLYFRRPSNPVARAATAARPSTTNARRPGGSW